MLLNKEADRTLSQSTFEILSWRCVADLFPLITCVYLPVCLFHHDHQKQFILKYVLKQSVIIVSYHFQWLPTWLTFNGCPLDLAIVMYFLLT